MHSNVTSKIVVGFTLRGPPCIYGLRVVTLNWNTETCCLDDRPIQILSRSVKHEKVRNIEKQENCDIKKMTAQCTVPWKFLDSLTTPMDTFPKLFWCQSLDTPTLPFFQKFYWAFVRMDPANVLTKFEVRIFTHSWDNWGHPKIWSVPGYAYSSLFSIILMGFCSDRPCECSGQIWSPYFTRSWDNSDWSFGWGVVNPNLGKEEVVGGRGWYRLKEPWWLPIGPP